MSMKLYRMKRLAPTYVTWDDHDYGKNDGGKITLIKRVKEILNIFSPEKSNNLSFGPGVEPSVELAGMNFLFLDGRSFRSEKRPVRHTLWKEAKILVKRNVQRKS